MDTLYKVLKEAEEADKKITPRTRRMNELLATPSTSGPDGHVKTPTLPDCMTKPVTPYDFRPDASPENHLYHKRKLLVWDQLHRPSNQSQQQQQKERRKSTPLSEIKLPRLHRPQQGCLPGDQSHRRRRTAERK